MTAVFIVNAESTKPMLRRKRTTELTTTAEGTGVDRCRTAKGTKVAALRPRYLRES
jgi:hypothetical protein